MPVLVGSHLRGNDNGACYDTLYLFQRCITEHGASVQTFFGDVGGNELGRRNIEAVICCLYALFGKINLS